MDMMAMALLFDMASRNRPWDERFEPRPPSRRRRFAKRLLSAVFRKRQPAETSEVAPAALLFPAQAASNESAAHPGCAAPLAAF
ncbi:hypothetical protein ACVIVC_005744 [Sinorhizobium meliloti]|nr:hypothetical protein [Sinorhizobium meliloti]MDE4600402.1 hypothetical protein [Sinorhizobium meliloti]UDU20031.1 hypothetical protein LJD24_03435 [Sinorhizobium meliloti]